MPGKKKGPMTILQAIITTLENSPNKQATLKEIGNSVSKLLGREIDGTIIRGTINRSLVSRKSTYPYPSLFVRVAPSTYALDITKNDDLS